MKEPRRIEIRSQARAVTHDEWASPESTWAAIGAAGASLLSALGLFLQSRIDQMIFSGVWVSSIAAAAASLAEGTWMSDADQVAFLGIVGFVAAAGVYVFLRESVSRMRSPAAPAARPEEAATEDGDDDIFQNAA